MFISRKFCSLVVLVSFTSYTTNVNGATIVEAPVVQDEIQSEDAVIGGAIEKTDTNNSSSTWSSDIFYRIYAAGEIPADSDSYQLPKYLREYHDFFGKSGVPAARLAIGMDAAEFTRMVNRKAEAVTQIVKANFPKLMDGYKTALSSGNPEAIKSAMLGAKLANRYAEGLDLYNRFKSNQKIMAEGPVASAVQSLKNSVDRFGALLRSADLLNISDKNFTEFYVEARQVVSEVGSINRAMRQFASVGGNISNTQTDGACIALAIAVIFIVVAFIRENEGQVTDSASEVIAMVRIQAAQNVSN